MSAVSVLMNGAVIYNASRRQSGASQTPIEAEVKVAKLVAEVLAAIVKLWSEIAGTVPMVRQGGLALAPEWDWLHILGAIRTM